MNHDDVVFIIKKNPDLLGDPGKLLSFRKRIRPDHRIINASSTSEVKWDRCEMEVALPGRLFADLVLVGRQTTIWSGEAYTANTSTDKSIYTKEESAQRPWLNCELRPFQEREIEEVFFIVDVKTEIRSRGEVLRQLHGYKDALERPFKVPAPVHSRMSFRSNTVELGIICPDNSHRAYFETAGVRYISHG